MISGAELEFGGGLGVAIFLCAYVCVCAGERERERDAFCRQDHERGARLTGSKLDCVCCIGVDFFMPQRRKY